MRNIAFSIPSSKYMINSSEANISIGDAHCESCAFQ